jgi:hypothetical protein
MPHNHDRRYKYLFSHAGFVRRLLEGFVDEAFVDDLDFNTLERVDGEFIDSDLTRRESDVVWRVNLRGHALYLFILIEFQSTVDHTMALRFLGCVSGPGGTIDPGRLHTSLPVLPDHREELHPRESAKNEKRRGGAVLLRDDSRRGD